MRVSCNLEIIPAYTTLAQLEELIAQIKQRDDFSLFTQIEIQTEIEHGYYNDVEVKILVVGTREETDEEKQLKQSSAIIVKELEIKMLEQRLALLKK